MYFFLLTSYSNYVAFDDKHLHDWISFEIVKAKIRKGAEFWKQPLDNIFVKMLYL